MWNYHTAHPATMFQDLLQLLWNDELFMQTTWRAAIKRAESTQVSHVTLMACLRSRRSVSLSLCLSTVWLCGALGRAAAPRPGLPRSGGAGGDAAEPGAHHHARHGLHPVHGLGHLAPGHLQRRERNRNRLLPHHCHRWAPPEHDPPLEPVIATHIIPVIPTGSTPQHTRLGGAGVRHRFFDRFQQSRKVRVNQGEVEYYKNQDIGAILPCPRVEQWEIIISSLAWVSSERIRGPASGNHLHTIQSMIVPLLLEPVLIMICSNFHLLSIYQSRGHIPSPLTPRSPHSCVSDIRLFYFLVKVILGLHAALCSP